MGANAALSRQIIWRQSGVVAGHREIKQRRIVQEVQPPLVYKGCAANAPLSRQITGVEDEEDPAQP